MTQNIETFTSRRLHTAVSTDKTNSAHTNNNKSSSCLFLSSYIYLFCVCILSGWAITDLAHYGRALILFTRMTSQTLSLQKRTSIIIRPSGEVRTELLAPLTFPCFLYHPRLLSNTPLCRRRSPSCSRSGILHLY